MRRLAFILCVSTALAFLPGRSTSEAEVSGKSRVVTARLGDVIRVPSVGARCRVSAEAGTPNLICHRAGVHRYEVYFYEDNLLVFRLGRPDRTAFSARGRP